MLEADKLVVYVHARFTWSLSTRSSTFEDKKLALKMEPFAEINNKNKKTAEMSSME
jgi:hypothetical protein